MNPVGEDSEIDDLCIELAATAIRLAAKLRARGTEANAEEMIARVLRAVERDRQASPDGTVSLAKARVARGLPALGRPSDDAGVTDLERVDVEFSFHGERAKEIARIAQQLHGQGSVANSKRVLTAATDRGLASIKRELGLV